MIKIRDIRMRQRLRGTFSKRSICVALNIYDYLYISIELPRQKTRILFWSPFLELETELRQVFPAAWTTVSFHSLSSLWFSWNESVIEHFHTSRGHHTLGRRNYTSSYHLLTWPSPLFRILDSSRRSESVRLGWDEDALNETWWIQKGYD